MTTRQLLLLLLLLPVLLLGGGHLLRQSGTEALFPGLDPDDVARIELAREREQVVLARRLDTKEWELLSAANAPGDAARIATALDRLAALRGRPDAGTGRASDREPLEIRLSDRRGDVLGHARIDSNEAVRLPDGTRLAIERAPALPLWQSAWSSLQPPRVPVEAIATIERLTPEGPVPLSADDTVAAAQILAGLAAPDFVAGAALSWSGASLYRVRLADGQSIDVQQMPDGDGRFHLRLTSDSITAIRAARVYAFRVAKALP